jgi:hypothetical protein
MTRPVTGSVAARLASRTAPPTDSSTRSDLGMLAILVDEEHDPIP